MPRHAAIDVGSNSIRLLIADVDELGRITPVHVDREVVRLGAGVFRTGRLDRSATNLAYRVLERMADATRALDVSPACGRSAHPPCATRRTAASSSSTPRASWAAPLEVVGGLEEARLVQRGVAAHWPHEHERVLIIDVGGGSVQLILSDRERFRRRHVAAARIGAADRDVPAQRPAERDRRSPGCGSTSASRLPAPLVRSRAWPWTA